MICPESLDAGECGEFPLPAQGISDRCILDPIKMGWCTGSTRCILRCHQMWQLNIPYLYIYIDDYRWTFPIYTISRMDPQICRSFFRNPVFPCMLPKKKSFRVLGIIYDFKDCLWQPFGIWCRMMIPNLWKPEKEFVPKIPQENMLSC